MLIVKAIGTAALPHSVQLETALFHKTLLAFAQVRSNLPHEVMLGINLQLEVSHGKQVGCVERGRSGAAHGGKLFRPR